MTLYSIYAKPDKGPDALHVLADRFSFGAWLFAPIWALGRGALAYLFVWIGVVAGLVLVAPVIGPDAAVAVYMVFALWTGFAAPAIASRALERRDWLAQGALIARDAETAELLWLEKTYGARP